MDSIFSFSHYRDFIQAQMRQMPNQGYGQSRRLANHLNLHTTMISQIMNGSKDLSLDHAALVAEFFALNDLESNYFIALVQANRAGNGAARRLATGRLEELRAKANEIQNRVQARGKLSQENRGVFYSDWSYTAIRQLTATEQGRTSEQLATRLNLPVKKVRGVLEFLLATQLCREEKGRLTYGPSSTHVESDSPWSRVHHGNWRERAIRSIDQLRPEDLHYTSPMTLAKSDEAVLRELILRFIESVNQVVDPSPSEELFCLNIDWFRV